MGGDGEPRGYHDEVVMPEREPGSTNPPNPAPTLGPSSFPDRTQAIRRAAARLCLALGWTPLHEVRLPNGRRADILALRADGGFACIEVKSGARDFLADAKWPEYRDYADALLFAVDADFPQDLLPGDVGLIVACDGHADLLRSPAARPLPPARRRALMHRFARLAATRLCALEDPLGTAEARAALLAE